MTKDEILSKGREIFDIEIDTLVDVKGAIDDSFAAAINMLFETTGKIVVTGIGKSGRIGQKISSTLTSTGTLSIFLHPAEGMHGDLGILQPDDIVLALGKSGESEELNSIIPVIRKIGAKIIAITSKKDSTLANSADIVLFAPVKKEACPLNLAPTNSTTAALVIGDALAVTLMEMRGFKEENFALFHPGGQLGKRLLLTVADVMRSGDENPVIEIDEPIPDLLSKITEKRAGAISVIDKDGKLLGLVTDFDIRKVLEKKVDLFTLTISDIMNKQPTCVYSADKAVTALETMRTRKKPITVLPVIEKEGDQVVGMIHLHDLLAHRI